jgi:ribose 1,5-bisphosphate isomerase
MEKYPQIEKIYDDIQKLNIQGATNVAISTFEGMRLYLSITKEDDPEKVLKEFFNIGERLSLARPNEPLARNGLKYVKHFFEKEKTVLPTVSAMKQTLSKLCDDYLEIISESKKELVKKSANYLRNYDKVFTHCHSSTAEELIKNLAHKDKEFEVVCTETRPRFQGRITAKNLVNAGIKTTLITDNSADSFIIGRGNVPIDVVLIGCDQIMKGGHVINKIGSWGMAMSAHFADKPVYVVTPLLKIDEKSLVGNVEIEIREDREIWPEAPKELEIYNPAFEIVDNVLITGFVCEFGIVKPTEVEKLIKEKYPWVTAS